jgi:hypothetical protein
MVGTITKKKSWSVFPEWAGILTTGNTEEHRGEPSPPCLPVFPVVKTFSAN